jgi:hypothetical protein
MPRCVGDAGARAHMTAEMLFSEGWLFAALLEMVEQHCGAGEGLLRSFGWKANARAMRLLAAARREGIYESRII